jgi:flavin-dependent dehydrogenase
MSHSDALVIGAGPTGLVLALWLTKLGVRVRIIDKTAEPGTTSRVSWPESGRGGRRRDSRPGTMDRKKTKRQSSSVSGRLDVMVHMEKI